MMGLSDGRKSFQIPLVVLIQYRLWQTASHPASHVAVAITLNAKASSLMTAKLTSLHRIWSVCTATTWYSEGDLSTRFYRRQEKTPKMFTISGGGGGFSPVSPLLRTPLWLSLGIQYTHLRYSLYTYCEEQLRTVSAIVFRPFSLVSVIDGRYGISLYSDT